jgi:hypothetical protein
MNAAVTPRSEVMFRGRAGNDDTVEAVLALLRATQLQVDNNRIEHEGFDTFSFSGSFQRFSRVFRIRTDDPATIARLHSAMTENRQRDDYLADVRSRSVAAADYEAILTTLGDEEGLARARAEWTAFRPAEGGEIKGLPLTPAMSRLLGMEQPPTARPRRPRP